MKIVAVTQARFGSSRLPGKVMMKIKDETLLDIHLKRAMRSARLDKLIVATTHEPESDTICAIAKTAGAGYYQGSMDDVLDRFYQAVKDEEADYVVRLTSDCPLIDAGLMDQIIDHCITGGLDYCSNALASTYPDGLDVEVFTFAALKSAWENAGLKSEREHVTPYIWKNSSLHEKELFTAEHHNHTPALGHLRLTVDEQKDFILLEQLITALGTELPWHDYVDHILKHPELTAVNANITRNEGYAKSLKND